MTESSGGVQSTPFRVSTDCEDMREQLEPYALGLLDAPEARAVEAHLATCPTCRVSLAEIQRTVASLPRALAHASPLRPPPALRQSVMQRVAAEPTSPAQPLQPATLASIVRRPRFTWRTFGGVAAAAVVALSLVWTAQLGVALARERALREELAQELATVSGQREIVLEVVDARDKTTRMLRAVPGAPREYATSYGKVYTRPDMPHVVAMTGRLPTPPPGHAYHLWLRLDGQTRLGGVLEINEAGFGQLVFQADRNGPAYESVWLTLQPSSSSPSSPSPGLPLLRWDPT